MDHPYKLQSTWFAFMSKLIPLVRILRRVSLFWHYPFAFLFFLLLFTSPMQPIIRFFLPLIIMCTLLCIIAFIGLSSLMEKSKESQRHGFEISCIDVLGLGGGWPAFDGSHPHSLFKQEGDFNPLMEELRSKTTIQTKNEESDVGQHGGDADSSLKKEIEPEGAWVSEPYDKLHLDTSISPSSISEGAVKRERKIRVKFKDEIFVIDGQERDKDRSSQMYDHDDADIHDGGLSFLTEKMQKIESDADSALNEQQDGVEDSGFQQNSDLMSEDGPCSDSALAEQQDGVEDSGFQQNSDLMSEDGPCSVTLKVEEIAQLKDIIAGTDVASNISQQLQLDSNSEHENNIQHEVDTQTHTQGKLEFMDVLHPVQNLAVELFQTGSNSNDEDNHLKQELGSELQIKDNGNGENVLVHSENLAAEMRDKLELDGQTNKENDSKPEIENKENDSKPEIESESQAEGEMCEMVVLSHELQPCRSSEEAASSKQDSGFAPRKWRDWVMGGAETDGLGTWSLGKGIFRIAHEKKVLTDFDEDYIGVAIYDEEFTFDEAFTAEDENGGTLLLEVSAFIQEISVKLQDVGGFETEFDQPIGSIVCGEKEGGPLCTVNEIRELMLSSCSHQIEAIDDFHTEEGDESSRWDEALDTTEKESIDSENEVGMIWPLTTDVTELGQPITEEEFQALKQKYHALEKEFKALQGEISLESLEQNSESRKTEEYNQDSDDSLDPYIRLFVECASDAEDNAQNTPHQSLKFSHKIPSKSGSNSRENPIRSSIGTKAFLRKPLLCGMNKVIKAIRGKKALNL